MQKTQSKKMGIGVRGVKPSIGRRDKNGYVHVISPATASEIRRELGIKRSQVANILRVFDAAGVKV